jgi:Fe-S-cluster containining protein
MSRFAPPQSDSSGNDDPLLSELRAVVKKVDDAVAAVVARAGTAITCQPGCSSCCVDGLLVLPVEAAAIAHHVRKRGLVHRRDTNDACVFLDDDGRCGVYEARPLLCRTHGLPLRTRQAVSRGGLRILDDISVCDLNYTDRAPKTAETLDADLLLQLLVTVDRRFRSRKGLNDDVSRVSLRALAASLVSVASADSAPTQ